MRRFSAACLVLFLCGVLPAWAVVVAAPGQPDSATPVDPDSAAVADASDTDTARVDSTCGCCTGPVKHCASEVREVCITLKYRPRCFDYAHRSLAPLEPCASPVQLPCAGHKELTPLAPCYETPRPEVACHKPLVPAIIQEPCGRESDCGCD